MGQGSENQFSLTGCLDGAGGVGVEGGWGKGGALLCIHSESCLPATLEAVPVSRSQNGGLSKSGTADGSASLCDGAQRPERCSVQMRHSG